MDPAVSTKGKTAQIRYELPHRIHDAKIYPVKAPNGSSISIYGHENGIRVLWRGGRPIKQAPEPRAEVPKPRKMNGTSADVIMLDDSDDDAQPTHRNIQQPEEAEFEEEEEEVDPDQPYPAFVQHLDLALSAEVFHVAVPQIPAIPAFRTADSIPSIFSHRIVFSVACADSSVRIITLPLNPPSAATKSNPTTKEGRWGEQMIKIGSHSGHHSIPKGLTMTWTSDAEPTFDEEEEEAEEEMDLDENEAAPTPRRKVHRQDRSRSALRGESGSWDLLVASHSADLGGQLCIWRFPIGTEKSANIIEVPHHVVPYQTVYLNATTSKIAFNVAQYPKRRHSQLLITDVSGIARIYDPFALINCRARRSRSAAGYEETGAFTSSFRTSFKESKDSSSAVPMLARRKPIIDAAWAADGRSIVALLADGEWGIWDIDRSGPKPPTDPTSFSLRGFVGTATSSTSSSLNSTTATPKKRVDNRSSLAPMTPNTRRTKQENLFHSTTSSTNVIRGGISIASLHSTPGAAPEDSVIIWYANEVYRIPKLAQYWGRSASGAGSGGSLLGPGLSKIQEIPLRGESIMALDQFDTTTKEARMAIPRDILITGEHRIIIITTSTSAQSGRDLGSAFARVKDEESTRSRVDQALLSTGELDLGGMDQLLDQMSNTGEPQRGLLTMGNPRKVLFASSTN
ncbi:hypothetical protein GQ43DRAFT_433108 [Delitschia confertaspora ATCC 74209]|uniref:Nucleoporin NUP37 n=1 Tax=Delitschia confertaspora ATCC 74209 TaxID=1513339 RepID=A0A9P4JMB2_9PLEO|nr:hypothetical protein GQ43DRAFT_433108 [Delitschia confertaspora ATCC 74209]